VQWLAVLRGILGLARGIMGWLQDQQMLDAGEAKAIRESLDETLELVEYASRVDRDTGSLSPDARERVRNALRDIRGS
jgi:hypothetical protein